VSRAPTDPVEGLVRSILTEHVDITST